MPAGGIVFAGRRSRAVAAPARSGDARMRRRPAGPYTPRAGAPLPRPASPPNAPLATPHDPPPPRRRGARRGRRARAPRDRRRRDVRVEGVPRRGPGQGLLHPRPRPRLRLAALDEAEEGPRLPPLPRHGERQGAPRDERAPPEGPRPPGPAAALQRRHDPRPALRPRAEGDREVLRPDDAGRRRRREAVGHLRPAAAGRRRRTATASSPATASRATARPTAR